MMHYTEADYIKAGYQFERATTPDSARARAEVIRSMLRTENPTNQTEARRLIEQGRQEARATA
jgi:hypothetical protein